MGIQACPRWRSSWSNLVAVLACACSLRCAAVSADGARLLQEASMHSSRAPSPVLASFIIALDAAKYDQMRQKLAADGVRDGVARAWGFNAWNASQMEAARSVLKEVGNDRKLAWHLRSKLSVCNHASPSKPLNWRDLLKGSTSVTIPAYDDLDDLFKSGQRKHHPQCSNSTMKTIAVAAAHVRLWKKLANGSLPAFQTHPAARSGDGWYLIVEDDVEFCPGWVPRLKEELLQAPADADVLKLSWVGRWRNKSSVGPFLEAPAEPYDGLTTDWMKDLMVKAFQPNHGVFKEVLGQNTLKTFSLSTFFGGGQAYMIRRSSLPKMIERLNGATFDHPDITLMKIGKTYAWRRVLAVEDGVRTQQLKEEALAAAKQVKKGEKLKAKEAKKAAKDLKAKDGKIQHEESPKLRKKKTDPAAALFREDYASGAGLDSVLVSVPICNKEPEDPADLPVVGGERKKTRKHKHKSGHGEPEADDA